MQLNQRLLKPLSTIALTVALAAFLPVQSASADTFDGTWSVQIKAETGNCPASRTVPIDVSNGRVSYSGRFNATASGKIGSNGALRVSFAHRDDQVVARGSLNGRMGYGSWTSPTKGCGGSWVARKA